MIPERTQVVVVNDNPEFLELMADVLHDERYPTTVIDGDRPEAVELIRAAVPQLLIIDLRLGRDEFHGLDVLGEVRRDPQLQELPILICTGDKEGLDSIQGPLAELRRVDTLMKPFTIQELMTKVEGLLAREPA